MVNLTTVLFFPKHFKNISNDSFWRKRQILRMSAHFYGRHRNCFSVAIRQVQRSLQYVVTGRKERKLHTREVWKDRINAACQELGHIPEGRSIFMESLARSEVYLNNQTLSNLAIWEPRTFKCLSKFAAVKAKQDELGVKALGPPPEGVYTRGKV